MPSPQPTPEGHPDTYVLDTGDSRGEAVREEFPRSEALPPARLGGEK
ncbi:hypothetical protein VTH06DRAFT_3376 [Thermothelomyces fergusii]